MHYTMLHWTNEKIDHRTASYEILPVDQTLLILQCDASDHGLGAALIRERKLDAFASQALTNVEKQYAQIEK